MNAAVLLIASVVVLVAGYVFYGGWLAKQWGIDPKRKTPAHELEDGMDYVPAKTPVVMGHHFSSIAGAGPINGPIQAAVFGWVPVLLWVLIGGIFFGGVHDFGALFASLRNKGQSIGEIIDNSMGRAAKKLFLTFGYLTLILVVAAFSSIVASTFGNTTAAGAAVEGATLAANESTAMISILFIALAIAFGFFIYRKNVPIGIASVVGVLGIVAIVALGLNFHPISLSYNAWMWIVGAYILVASVTPVWILLQPRDYLSSFLLYFMIAAGIIAVIGGVVSGNGNFQVPAFGDAALKGTGVFTTGTAFPALFVTIACGAISGFHSLVSSGTSAKQLDNEKNARPVAYGSMLIECLVAVISLCAIGFVWAAASDGTYASPTQVFAGGLSAMIGCFAPGLQNIMYQLLILAVSVFCLTSLDTATRLARYMFQEFFLHDGQTNKDVTGVKKVITNPYVSTALTVVLGVALGMNGYTKIWPLFGAANQLLAAIGLLAVCTWLGSVGKNNKMFYIPMTFMLAVTICSLGQTIKAKMTAYLSGAADYWALIQSVIAVLLVALSVVLAVIAVKTLLQQHKEKASGSKEKAA
ncbi:carbon starvation protein A [Butyrivibrio sp. DSM 10294]|uniref:carbon starvation CstA family protein n=1 Tax=Butyrivibrio sp. DSM 10294 TaxID=2972457 RepID=UPI00234F8D1C|nr:carbon starvation protein A [Butyrivibrio sp. DSM 10294]MDC7292713.1 carbon starvation protein A [Butyrivibrio sp. DSM 10294]